MTRSILIALTLVTLPASAQETDPIYDRPFVTRGDGSRTAVGGYLEGNTNYFSEDGISEGFSMELRRFNIFLYSAIGSRVTFFSELEFEHGTEEIGLETAMIDVSLGALVSLRGGILLPPLGTFNQNHDSPKWPFVDRPLVSTELIPSTLSEVGFGLHGRIPTGTISLGYQIYLVNGLGDGVVNNTQGRTHIPSGKSGKAFGEDNNGEPAVVARVDVSDSRFGRFGLSFYSGTYNSWRVEGEAVDDRRGLRILALDMETRLGAATLVGEAATAWIDLPDGLTGLFGDRQLGAFLDIGYPVFEGPIGALPEAAIALAIRLERLDLNVGTFARSGDRIYDEQTAVAVGLTLEPNSETIFKLNYRYHWQRDLLGNPVRLGGIQAGFATYF
jgi:hypothetical protein